MSRLMIWTLAWIGLIFGKRQSRCKARGMRGLNYTVHCCGLLESKLGSFVLCSRCNTLLVVRRFQSHGKPRNQACRHQRPNLVLLIRIQTCQSRPQTRCRRRLFHLQDGGWDIQTRMSTILNPLSHDLLLHGPLLLQSEYASLHTQFIGLKHSTSHIRSGSPSIPWLRKPCGSTGRSSPRPQTARIPWLTL
jgi:hypothetical protein